MSELLRAQELTKVFKSNTALNALNLDDSLSTRFARGVGPMILLLFVSVGMALLINRRLQSANAISALD